MPNLIKNLKTGIGRIEFDLDEQEYCAIGRVTAQWAYLEHGVYAVTKGIATAVGIDVPQDALSTSFKRRLRALRLLIEECAPDGEKERLLKILDKIANAEQDRHKITHAMWDWDRAHPDRISASSFRPGLEFEKKFDAQKMHDLADRISEISFELEYPEGWDAALREILKASTGGDGKASFSHISRQLSRDLSLRKVPAPKESARPKPRSGKRPQPSSEG